MVRRAQPYLRPSTADARVRAWLDEIRGSVARRRLRLEPRAAALLVVDLQRYFASAEGRCYLPACAAILPRTLALLEAWRALGRPVLFTRHGHQGPEDLGMLGRFYSDHIRAGEPDAALLDELAPREDEPVLDKTTYDAFLGTDLEARLRERGAAQVLIAGVLTHLCCETTARAAFCRGFEVYVAADATATSTETLHLGSLRAIADGIGVVMSTAEILASCPPPVCPCDAPSS